jgi:sialate O-acetylesterase
MHRRTLTALGILTIALAVAVAPAAVRLPAVVGNNMVLQRGRPVAIWGWDTPGRKVTVKFAGRDKAATAGDDGKWAVALDAMEASAKPADMTIAGSTTVTLTGILVGEVWLCSGQSNMEQGMKMIDNAAKEIAAAKYPNLRLFLVPKRPSLEPLPDVAASWKPCTPETAVQGGWGGFSAVAYFFGRTLHKELGVPIGLIESSWGGTRIEPWTPPVGLAAVKRFQDVPKQLQAAAERHDNEKRAFIPRVEQWVVEAKAAQEAGRPFPPLPQVPGQRVNHQGPTALYNGMVHALVPFAIRGAIWYQGESNNGEGMLYFERMQALIAGWRAVWNQPDLAFYYVQLAPYRYGRADPKNLAGIWEAQTAALSIPHTGMAVTVDIGNVRDIHPRNKQDVGKRLALWALAKNYAKADLVYSGPLYKSMEIDGGKVRITFDHVGGGLVSRDGKPLTWFTVAGDDGKFVEAAAEIEPSTGSGRVGDAVVVSSGAVAAPKAVRFGWADNAEPNLSNKEGLPASPFRTDRPKGFEGPAK